MEFLFLFNILYYTQKKLFHLRQPYVVRTNYPEIVNKTLNVSLIVNIYFLPFLGTINSTVVDRQYLLSPVTTETQFIISNKTNESFSHNFSRFAGFSHAIRLISTSYGPSVSPGPYDEFFLDIAYPKVNSAVTVQVEQGFWFYLTRKP